MESASAFFSSEEHEPRIDKQGQRVQDATRLDGAPWAALRSDVQPHDLYSDQLSPEEANLGFMRVYVSNPDRHYYGRGSIVPAVILPIPHALRIIKLNNPMEGGFSYPIQGFGDFPGGGLADPDWKTIITAMPNLQLAMKAAARGQEVPFVLGAPVIELRCPECTHEFQQQAEFLPIGCQTACPKCKHSDSTEDFNAFNL